MRIRARGLLLMLLLVSRPKKITNRATSPVVSGGNIDCESEPNFSVTRGVEQVALRNSRVSITKENQPHDSKLSAENLTPRGDAQPVTPEIQTIIDEIEDNLKEDSGTESTMRNRKRTESDQGRAPSATGEKVQLEGMEREKAGSDVESVVDEKRQYVAYNTCFHCV